MRTALAMMMVLAAATLLAGERRFEDPMDPRPEAQSNMAFLVDIDSPAIPGQGGVSLRSLPLSVGTADLADPTATPPCSEPGAPQSDGVVDALDLACELWESRQGSLWIWHLTAAGAWEGRGVWRLPGGGVAHGGSWTDPIVLGEAIAVHALAPPGGSVTNSIRFAGAHLPLPCPSVGPGGGLLNIFYHTMYRTADELLCGLRNRDWSDADGDGLPDTCDASLFDPSAGGSTCVSDVRDGITTTRCVFADSSLPTDLRFEGTDFNLEITFAASVSFSPEQPGAVWCQPHF